MCTPKPAIIVGEYLASYHDSSVFYTIVLFCMYEKNQGALIVRHSTEWTLPIATRDNESDDDQ